MVDEAKGGKMVAEKRLADAAGKVRGTNGNYVYNITHLVPNCKQ